MNTPFRPCPFCGGADPALHLDDGFGHIECPTCGACGPESTSGHAAGAAALWNHRSARAPASLNEAVDELQEAIATLMSAVETTRGFIPAQHHAQLDGYIARVRALMDARTDAPAVAA